MISVSRATFPFPEEVRALVAPPPRTPIAEIAAALAKADFPLKRHYHGEEDARRWFAALRAYPRDPWTRTVYSMRFRFRDRARAFGPPFLFDGEPHLLAYDDTREYEQIDRLTDLFTEDLRVRARRVDSPESPMAAWEGSTDFRERVVRAAMPNLDAHSLREAVWRVHGREATGFKQSFAISVLRRLGARRVLDISAGWGDRLVAAIAAGVDRYVAADPNFALRRGHEAIVQRLRGEGGPPSVAIHYEPFEDADLGGEAFDTVFTSPPYFDFETYTDLPGQSIQRFTTLDSWTKGWLFPALAKAWGALGRGGNLAVHMCDGRIAEPMLLFAATLPGAAYRGVLACTGSKPNPRPVWVFRKTAALR